MTAVKSFTAAERAEVQRYFIESINEMKKKGLPDVSLIKKAFTLAQNAHDAVRRDTGEPYIMHPLRVARILIDAGCESDMVAAALLHDVKEDAGVTSKMLENGFGIGIADQVEAVTGLNVMNVSDREISKHDLDDLTDEKFLKDSKETYKAAYIKCADRIDNLRTMEGFSEEKQKAKVDNTRNVIIPQARMLHINGWVEVLGDLCLKIEKPELFKEIKAAYEDVLRKNRFTFEGDNGLIAETSRMITEDSRFGRYIERVEFKKRCVDCIHTELSDNLNGRYTVKEAFANDKVPLFDIFFVASDLYMDGGPESLFFSIYDKLHESRYRFTIVEVHQGDYESYYLLKDKYGHRYRLFIQSDTEYLAFTYGLLVSDASNEGRNGYVNNADGDKEEKLIPVYKKDGTVMMIEEGASVLDFAFKIDPNIGICTKWAHLNGSTSRTPIYTKLKPGDIVEVVSDHNKENPAEDIPHCTIRWFEYVHTRAAIKSLSRFLEKHSEYATHVMQVQDAQGKTYEIEMASTVLDFAFAVDVQAALHLKAAYVNKSPFPAELDKTLRYGDKVRFEFDENDQNTPQFMWLSFVKTKRAKDHLIAYFYKKFEMQGGM